LHVRTYVLAAVSGPVVAVPVSALLPDQPPDATQEVAFEVAHCSVALAPLETALGLAVRVTTGAGEVTDTVVDCVALPAGPLQVSVYVVFAVSAPVDWDPLSGSLPDQPPAATQAVALVLDQFSVDAAPEPTVLGLAFRVTDGRGELTVTTTDCDAAPPAPSQIKLKSVVLVRGPVDTVPLVAWAPVQPPDAVQVVAFVDVQVSVAVPPLAIVVGEALSVTDGATAVTTISVDCVVVPLGPVHVSV